MFFILPTSAAQKSTNKKSLNHRKRKKKEKRKDVVVNLIHSIRGLHVCMAGVLAKRLLQVPAPAPRSLPGS